MKDFVIHEERTYLGKCELKLYFKGTKLRKKINHDKIKALIDAFLSLPNLKNNMQRNITFIRTIFKDFKEEYLLMSICDTDHYVETIKYENSHLYLYEYKSNTSQININYTYGSRINLSFSDFDNEIVENKNSKSIISQVNSSIEYVFSLKDVKSIELDYNDKTLIEVYKVFYGEFPNFNEKDINLKVQTMMCILSNFGININLDYSFTFYQMPISYDLEAIVKRLFPFGNIDEIDNPITLEEKPKQIIEIAGKEIRKFINCSSGNIKDELIAISSMVYKCRFNLTPAADIKEISISSEYPENKVQSVINIMERIENQI